MPVRRRHSSRPAEFRIQAGLENQLQQTPLHDNFNPDILKILPKDLKRIVEVGSSSGALARAYRQANPACEYIGIEVDPKYAEASKRFCTEVICGNIESFGDDEFTKLFPSDCWIFGDALEHLYDPWALLGRIRKQLPETGRIVACIPNAQHWSLQASLNCGQFRYQDQGLLDRTHIRWFTRLTIIEMFQAAGYKIVEGFPRVFDEPQREMFFPAIRAMALALGGDPQQAVDDATPLQWVIKAMPA